MKQRDVGLIGREVEGNEGTGTCKTKVQGKWGMGNKHNVGQHSAT
jgi:hypothetical protein